MNTKNDNEIARYIGGRCILSDSSPAPVLSGMSISKLPESYIEFYKNDLKKAEKKWKATKKWRIQQNIWRIHTIEQHSFYAMKRAHKHYFHGLSKLGIPVTYEQPGKMKLKDFFRSGFNIEDAVRHNLFLVEYICNCIYEKDEVARFHKNKYDWGFYVILDMKGFNIKHLNANVLKYILRVSDENSKHYPLTLKKIFFINTPNWFVKVFNTIQWMIPENNRESSFFLSNDYLPILLKYFDKEQIPIQYGGSSPYALGQHPFETGLHDLVVRLNK